MGYPRSLSGYLDPFTPYCSFVPRCVCVSITHSLTQGLVLFRCLSFGALATVDTGAAIPRAPSPGTLMFTNAVKTSTINASIISPPTLNAILKQASKLVS